MQTECMMDGAFLTISHPQCCMSCNDDMHNNNNKKHDEDFARASMVLLSDLILKNSW